MKAHKIAGVLALTVMWVGGVTALAQQEGHGREQQKPGAMHGQDKGGEKVAPAKLPLCPVMGDPVDFNVKTMTKDGPVYFCCPMCIEKFEDQPAKYADRVAKQRAALAKLDHVQVNCPVTGNPIDGKTSIMSGGQRVSFCCPDCVAKYEKDPAKYAAKLLAGYTYQTRCPVTGEKIDPTVYLDLPTGERVYFCCKSCEGKLLKDPAKYAENLEKQGVPIDAKKVKEALAKGAGHEKSPGHGTPDHR